jgi:ketosteroid isomerase-like protein
MTLTLPGQEPKRMTGYTVGVLRKEADGYWRLARDANLVMPRGRMSAKSIGNQEF